MEKIIIGFSRPNKWKLFAWLILKAYSIPYDHVYIRWHSDNLDRDLIYQASSTMVNFMSSKIFVDHNIIVDEFSFVVPEEKRKALLQFCIDNAGVPYGIKSVLGLAWVRINEWFGRRIDNPFRDQRNSYVCCELGALILEDFINVEIDIDLDTINPKELYDIVKKLSVDQ